MAQSRKRGRKRAGGSRTRNPSATPVDPAEQRAARRARTEAKNAAARAALEPLDEGQRPRAVTVAAAIAFLLALGTVVSYATGTEINGERPHLLAGAQVLLMLVMAAGLWKARYWAVLGMQALLVFVIVIFSLVGLKAESLLAVLLALAVIGGAGTLFWHMIKALARIQMPLPPGSLPR